MNRPVAALCGLLLLAVATGSRAAELVLVENGTSRAPIVVAAGASPETLRAAGELAGYMEKISGAKPPILHGMPASMPARAIWIGLQPGLTNRFPGVTLAFQHSEEILIACTGEQLLIAGRDRMAGTNEVECGTANAVYTFLQKQLDVRWFWPGPLGEDVIQKATIAIAPMEYRFHPIFLQRGIYRRPRYNEDWCRLQRIGLDSLKVSAGHGFANWWDLYHTNHPDYFALQPEGRRNGYPEPAEAKLCPSNPRVWEQWWENTAQSLKDHPERTVFNASPNDGARTGYCVCDKCNAWDATNGPLCELSWETVKTNHVALTDRYARFWNTLGRGLKQRFPDRELWVYGMAYGDALRTPPVATRLDDNIVIGFVGSFPLSGRVWREEQKAQWLQWTNKASRLLYRPNLFWYSGGMSALPTTALRETIEDFRFLAENRCVGLIVDTTPEHWGTQGPLYYAMAQLAWDPLQDAGALMDDYYRRAFGAGADPLRRYFELMEEAHREMVETPGWRPGGRSVPLVFANCARVYNAGRMAQAEALVKRAEALVSAGPERYRRRVAFMRAGFDFTKLQLDIIQTMQQVRDTNGRAPGAVQKAADLCAARDRLLAKEENRYVVSGDRLKYYIEHRKLTDYLGPPSERFLKGRAPARKPVAVNPNAVDDVE